MAKLGIHEIGQRPGGSWMVRVTLPGESGTEFLKFPPSPEPPSRQQILDSAEKLQKDLHEIKQARVTTMEQFMLKKVLTQLPPPPAIQPWWVRLLRWLGWR